MALWHDNHTTVQQVCIILQQDCTIVAVVQMLCNSMLILTVVINSYTYCATFVQLQQSYNLPAQLYISVKLGDHWCVSCMNLLIHMYSICLLHLSIGNSQKSKFAYFPVDGLFSLVDPWSIGRSSGSHQYTNPCSALTWKLQYSHTNDTLCDIN